MNNTHYIFGLLGEHIEKSLSPFIHKRLIDYYSMNYSYFPFQISSDSLQERISEVKSQKLRGLNVTNPFKEKSIAFMDFIDDYAKKIGAINTIVCQNGSLYGYNTDWIGFKISVLQHCKINLKNKKAVLLGAGGVARAIVFALAQEKCTAISVFNRSEERALQLATDFKQFFPSCLIKGYAYDHEFMQKEVDQSDILINVTPLGSYYCPCADPLPANIVFPSSLIVYDLVYNPDKTLLLKRAESNGNFIINGKSMLVYQAAESFYLWSGIHPNQAIINDILTKLKSYKFIKNSIRSI